MAIKSNCPWGLIRPLRDYILFSVSAETAFIGYLRIQISVTWQVPYDDGQDRVKDAIEMKIFLIKPPRQQIAVGDVTK
jgi:hypothetical protein